MKFVACFIIFENKILTVKRSSNEVEGGKNGLIGGGIEDGELAIDSMTREIREEINLQVNGNDLIDLGNHKLPFNGVEVEFNCYKLNLKESFNPKLDPNEAEGFEWVTIDELLSKPNLVSGLGELIEILGKDRIVS